MNEKEIQYLRDLIKNYINIAWINAKDVIIPITSIENTRSALPEDDDNWELDYCANLLSGSYIALNNTDPNSIIIYNDAFGNKSLIQKIALLS